MLSGGVFKGMKLESWLKEMERFGTKMSGLKLIFQKPLAMHNVDFWVANPIESIES